MMNWIVLALAVLLAAPRTHERQETARKAEAMAERIWVSTTGDLTAAASWNPSGIPANGDILIWDGTSQTSITSNLSGLSLVAPARWHFTPEYTGTIGSAGDPLLARGNAGTEEFIYMGSGIAYLRDLAPALRSFFDSSGEIILSNPSAAVIPDNIYIRGPTRVTVVSTSGISDVFLIQGNFGAPTLDIQGDTVTSVGPFFVQNGAITCERDLGSNVLDMIGGTWDQLSGQITDVNLNGGTLIYRSADTITNADVFAGILDLQSDPKARTVTNLLVAPSGTVLKHSGVTITNLLDLSSDVPIFP